jgi:hypothetical protein
MPRGIECNVPREDNIDNECNVATILEYVHYVIKKGNNIIIKGSWHKTPRNTREKG